MYLPIKAMKTDYASPERSAEDKIKIQFEKVISDPTLKKILDAIPEAVLILNSNRQIVYCNATATQILKAEHIDKIFGKRPGEALGCPHAFQSEGGCGTTTFCKYCGAVNSILESQVGNTTIEECCIMPKDADQAFELRVKSSPFYIDGEMFTIFSVTDVTDEKHRQCLERIFFHDILNTAGGLQGYSELLLSADESEIVDFKKAIFFLSEQLIDEINAQRQMLLAEKNDLTVNMFPLESLDLIDQIVLFYSQHQVAMDKSIKIIPDCENISFSSDEILLSRVLGNLLKNALEASDFHESVSIGCKKEKEEVVFQVKNKKVIPEDVQMQLFKKSFSTKGKGRGLGTYSIKLLTEKYLKGRVSFESNHENGTTFSIYFPLLSES